MNEQQKRVLISKQDVLARNIVWSDALEERLVDSGLITQSVLAELRKCSKKEERTDRLIKHLSLPGQNHNFSTFCDVLQLSGHVLLADFFRFEASNDNGGIDMEEMFQKFPALERGLSDSQKKQFILYIKEQIDQKALFTQWGQDPETKQAFMDMKEQQISQLISFHKENETKEKIIRDLNKKIEDDKDEAESMKSEVKRLKNKILEKESAFTNSLQTQIQQNVAGESTLLRAQNKADEYAKYVNVIISRLCHGFGKNSVALIQDCAGVKELEVKTACSLLDELFVKVAEMDVLVKDMNKLQDDVRWVILHMGVDTEKDLELVKSYRIFIVKNDERVQSFNSQIKSYEEELKILKKQMKDEKENSQEQTNVFIERLKKEVQDLKTNIYRKSKKITELEQELAFYKSRDNEMSSKIAHMTSSVPVTANDVTVKNLELNYTGGDSRYNRRRSSIDVKLQPGTSLKAVPKSEKHTSPSVNGTSSTSSSSQSTSKRQTPARSSQGKRF